MSQWISIEAAAEKYRLEKEYIWLWVEILTSSLKKYVFYN